MTIVESLNSGDGRRLAAAWLHLAVSFMVWLLMAALSVPLARELDLSDHEIALLVALPLLGGAVLRIVAGWSCDWIGARPTALAILLGEFLTLLWGWLGVSGYGEALALAACLGLAGSSFAVSLPLAGRAYPPSAGGLVLGLTGSGNIGAVFVLFFAPRWAAALGWHGVFAVMAVIVFAVSVLFMLLVRRDDDATHRPAHWWHDLALLVRGQSIYWLCFLYAVTFGGFVGLCSLLPFLLHDHYGLGAVAAGTVAASSGLLGSLIRPVGGYVADRRGGLATLHYVFPVVAGSVVAVTSPSFGVAVAMMVVALCAMGFGNGVMFQLVAEGFPKAIGLASGIVGAVGALGGFVLPLWIGSLKSLTGSYDLGLWTFSGLAICAWGTVIVKLRAESASGTEPST